MAPTHTPGPWKAFKVNPASGDWGHRVLGPNNHELDLTVQMPDPDEEAANAHLIAAAPKLLALVRDIRNLDHVNLAHGDKALLEDLREWKAAARAAIAKAEGKP